VAEGGGVRGTYDLVAICRGVLELESACSYSSSRRGVSFSEGESFKLAVPIPISVFVSVSVFVSDSVFVSIFVTGPKDIGELAMSRDT
jgi:hypothetical protein